jgi:hypothetical protein
MLRTWMGVSVFCVCVLAVSCLSSSWISTNHTHIHRSAGGHATNVPHLRKLSSACVATAVPLYHVASQGDTSSSCLPLLCEWSRTINWELNRRVLVHRPINQPSGFDTRCCLELLLLTTAKLFLFSVQSQRNWFACVSTNSMASLVVYLLALYFVFMKHFFTSLNWISWCLL